ncbi:hypothetical protein GCM10011380_25200 [Sphingomonas metalli]|uniref:Uncharacterized protein n=1 Tax=Sphingomonas metalli TaxID=1779358 RepID=A0A916T7D3_9SPHN|nr:hypothetical protein [Sphingomonas metalli]GGB34720.1 hypothetical protein GCM10011380_25200 [Sphingomonas metalli]
MSWGGPGFVIAIIAISTFGIVINNWIRTRHGYAPTDNRGGQDAGPDADRKIRLLTTDNEKLAGQVGRLEERIAVLERIVTDPAHRTAREIDSLR